MVTAKGLQKKNNNKNTNNGKIMEKNIAIILASLSE